MNTNPLTLADGESLTLDSKHGAGEARSRFASSIAGTAPANPVLLAFREYVVDPYDQGLAWCASLCVDALEGRLSDAFEVCKLLAGLEANEAEVGHAVAVLSRLDRVARVVDPLHFHGEVVEDQRIELNRAYRGYAAALSMAPHGDGMAAASAFIESLMRYAGVRAIEL